jgi:hypothetical protein
MKKKVESTFFVIWAMNIHQCHVDPTEEFDLEIDSSS